MSTDGLKIPAKHYVGMVNRENEKLPLAFITPYGEDQAAKKRMSTVDDWVANNRRWNKSNPLPKTVIDNKPLSGFKITSDIRTTSHGSLDKWRIEDPRGFELEITSANLARLMSVGMIDRGEINDRCVWARFGGNNVLLSTSTEEYQKAIANTEVAGLTANWKDAKVGNGVILQNNLRGVWLGKMHLLERSSQHAVNSTIGNNELVPSDKSYHAIFVDEAPPNCSQYYHSQLHLIANPKLASIDASSSMTDAQAEIMANELVSDQKCHVNINGYKSVMALSASKINIEKDVSIGFDPVEINDDADLEKIISSRYYDASKLYLTNGEPDKLFEIGGGRLSGNLLSAMVYDLNAFNDGMICKRYKVVENRSYYSSSTRMDRETHSFDWNPNQRYARIKITLRTKAGNSIEVMLK